MGLEVSGAGEENGVWNRFFSRYLSGQLASRRHDGGAMQRSMRGAGLLGLLILAGCDQGSSTEGVTEGEAGTAPQPLAGAGGSANATTGGGSANGGSMSNGGTVANGGASAGAPTAGNNATGGSGTAGSVSGGASAGGTSNGAGGGGGGTGGDEQSVRPVPGALWHHRQRGQRQPGDDSGARLFYARLDGLGRHVRPKLRVRRRQNRRGARQTSASDRRVRFCVLRQAPPRQFVRLQRQQLRPNRRQAERFVQLRRAIHQARSHGDSRRLQELRARLRGLLRHDAAHRVRDGASIGINTRALHKVSR